MSEKHDIEIHLVSNSETGERKAALISEAANVALLFNLAELYELTIAIKAAIDYIEKHGTYITESVPEGAVRH